MSEPLRPRDFAMLLLASGDLLPRQRARDQQADLAGAELKRRVLDRIVELDPEADSLEVTLERVIHEIGGAAGPARAIAAGVAAEFVAARRNPEFVAWLFDQAAERSSTHAASRDRAGEERTDRVRP